MKKIIVTTLMLFLFGFSLLKGQSIVKYTEIQKNVTDSTSTFFYPNLVEKFNFNPTLLDSLEATHLYYGQIAANRSTPLFGDKNTVNFKKFFNKKKYEKAILIGKEILENNPTNLSILIEYIHCLSKIDEYKKLEPFYTSQLTVLIQTILKNGTGEGRESPFYVMSIADEYIILGILDFDNSYSRSSLTVEDGVFDFWESKKKDKKPISFKVYY